MVLTSVAPAPSFLDRFCAAWRGEESLAWVFWCYYVLVGLCLGFIHVTALLVLGTVSGSDPSQFSDTPIGQAYALLIDLVQLGYFGIAFILFVRCISNINWRGWQYAAMLFLLGIGYQVVQRARDLGAVFLGA
jgi:hypothetical protein